MLTRSQSGGLASMGMTDDQAGGMIQRRGSAPPVR